MARAALGLLAAGRDDDDLRVPMAAALLELYGDRCDERRLVAYVEALLPIELYELHPSGK